MPPVLSLILLPPRGSGCGCLIGLAEYLIVWYIGLNLANSYDRTTLIGGMVYLCSYGTAVTTTESRQYNRL